MRPLTAALLVLLVGAGCGDGAAPPEAAPPIRIYTTVTQETVDAVVETFSQAEPDVEVEVFRAPTGEVAARIAAERREGRLRADVLWLTDPLSMQQYAADGLLHPWTPTEAEAVPSDFRTERFVGTRVLNLVIVHRPDLQPPLRGWDDLATRSLPEGIAVPDPGFAGSAFAALAFFALHPDYGMDYVRELAGNGMVQVSSPGEVVAGVAEGRYSAGITLDNPARTAVERGSPLQVVWPEPGAIAVYSPIAVVEGGDRLDIAVSFADHVLTRTAQEAIADTGWQPVRPDVEWPERGPQLSVDWSAAFDRQEELLDEYRSIVGG